MNMTLEDARATCENASRLLMDQAALADDIPEPILLAAQHILALEWELRELIAMYGPEMKMLPPKARLR